MVNNKRNELNYLYLFKGKLCLNNVAVAVAVVSKITYSFGVFYYSIALVATGKWSSLYSALVIETMNGGNRIGSNKSDGVGDGSICFMW